MRPLEELCFEQITVTGRFRSIHSFWVESDVMQNRIRFFFDCQPPILQAFRYRLVERVQLQARICSLKPNSKSVAGMALLILTACGGGGSGGVSQSLHDQVQADLTDALQKISTLEDRLLQSMEALSQAKSRVSALEEQIRNASSGEETANLIVDLRAMLNSARAEVARLEAANRALRGQLAERLPAGPTIDLRQAAVVSDARRDVAVKLITTRGEETLLVGVDHSRRGFIANTGPAELGVDYGQRLLDAVPVVGTRDDLMIRYGAVDDGITRTEIEQYFRAIQDDGVILSFPRRPRAILIGGHTDYELDLVTQGIQLLNSALPQEFRIQALLVDETLNSTARDRGTFPYDDTIYIEFVSADAFGDQYESVPEGTAGGSSRDGETQQWAHVRLNREGHFYQGSPGWDLQVVVHELVHAMGFYGHTGDASATLWGEGNRSHVQPVTILHVLDRAALQALYMKNLGEWESTAWHLHGEAPATTFGAVMQNGFVEPWAYGPLPVTDLANNTVLSGTATWMGTLLGFSQERPVVGDTQIDVTLATLTGTTDFTNLETWTGDPGNLQPGSGTRWGDGDLGYTIAVEGNTFTQTGGDEGILTGIFTGANHEGAGGVLERSDLTAAFGATR